MECTDPRPIAPDNTDLKASVPVPVELFVNGQQHRISVRVQDRLSSVLRDVLGLTGLKEGCLEGECGACTVLLDGLPVNACLVLAFQIDGRQITTIEGMENLDGSLSSLQQAFVDRGAVQCGYCTPGMVMAAEGLLQRNPNPTEGEIGKALGGNLCRCTGFQNIVQAVKSVANR